MTDEPNQPAGEVVTCRTIRVRPGRARATLAWIASFLALSMSPAALSLGPTAPLLLAPFLGLLTFIGWTLLDRRTISNAPLSLEAEGVRMPAILGSRTVTRSDLESAYETDDGLVLKTRSGAVVELALVEKRSDVILHHLGLTLDQGALTAPLRGVLGGFTRGLLTFVFSLPAFTLAAVALAPRNPYMGLWPVGALLASLAFAVLVAGKLRPRVVVGVDGIRVIGVLRPVFIPHREIVDVGIVDSAGFESLLIHAGTRTYRLPLIGQSGAEADALLRRIAEGRRRQRGSAGARDLTVLDRAGLSFDAWRESLRRASRSSGGFRAAALEARDFEEVLEDPAAPMERRVGAALALRDHGGDARDRIRIAASTSAEPRIRIALEAVASEDVDETTVESALRMPTPG